MKKSRGSLNIQYCMHGIYDRSPVYQELCPHVLYNNVHVLVCSLSCLHRVYLFFMSLW